MITDHFWDIPQTSTKNRVYVATAATKWCSLESFWCHSVFAASEESCFSLHNSQTDPQQENWQNIFSWQLVVFMTGWPSYWQKIAFQPPYWRCKPAQCEATRAASIGAADHKCAVTSGGPASSTSIVLCTMHRSQYRCAGIYMTGSTGGWGGTGCSKTTALSAKMHLSEFRYWKSWLILVIQFKKRNVNVL